MDIFWIPDPHNNRFGLPDCGSATLHHSLRFVQGFPGGLPPGIQSFPGFMQGLQQQQQQQLQQLQQQQQQQHQHQVSLPSMVISQSQV